MSDGAGPDRDGEGRDEEADLAADYVLGVLGGAERRAAERRIARDPDFAGEVRAWEARLGPLVRAVPEEKPPADLWARVEDELSRLTRAPLPARAVPPERPRGRRVSAVWQYIGLGGLGLAAVSGAALLLVAINAGGLLGPAPALSGGAMMAATLASDAGAPLFTVVVDEASGTATLIPVVAGGGAADPAHVHELWLVPPGGAPRSLGLLGEGGPIRLRMVGEGMANPQGALAVSLEPAGGSPTGLPTGPVVASGPLQAI